MRFEQPSRYVFRQSTPLAANVRATVKWFDPDKGFGFVSTGSGAADALLPASVLKAAGREKLPEGATVVVDLVRGPKGAQVGTIHEIDLSTVPDREPRRPQQRDRSDRKKPSREGFGGRSAPAPRLTRDDRPRADCPTRQVVGTVKWFNATKGFGFIAPDEGNKDIFVHAKVVERSNIGSLTENQRVLVTVRQGEKGLEAISLSPL